MDTSCFCTYVRGTDYRINYLNGEITWLVSNGPTEILANYSYIIPNNTGLTVAEQVLSSQMGGSLSRSPIKTASEVITSLDAGCTYVAGVDYCLNYASGALTWLLASSCLVSDNYAACATYTNVIPAASLKVTAKDKVYIFDGFFWREGQDDRYIFRKASNIVDMSGGSATLWFIPDSGAITVTSLDETTTYTACGVNYNFDAATGCLTWVTPAVTDVKVKYPVTSSTAELTHIYSTLYKTFTWKLLIYNEVRQVTRETVVSSAYIDYLDGYPVLYILTSGQIIDEYGQIYNLSVDYTVEYATGKIIWTNQPGTKTPPLGRKYYVDYVFSLASLIDYMTNLLKHPQYNIYHVSGLGFGLVAFGVFPFGSPWST
jgi:hypothetical protein